jgi:DNA-binding transcriptional ArsR family regulator
MGRPERGPQEEIDRLFHALGEPTRRRIVEMLSERPHSVSALAEPLGISVTAVTQHLHVLAEAGLVRTEKLGRVRSCQIVPKGLDPVRAWLDGRRSLWERRLDHLVTILPADEEPDES